MSGQPHTKETRRTSLATCTMSPAKRDPAPPSVCCHCGTVPVLHAGVAIGLRDGGDTQAVHRPDQFHGGVVDERKPIPRSPVPLSRTKARWPTAKAGVVCKQAHAAISLWGPASGRSSSAPDRARRIAGEKVYKLLYLPGHLGQRTRTGGILLSRFHGLTVVTHKGVPCSSLWLAES
jgi:hypothetical protein